VKHPVGDRFRLALPLGAALAAGVLASTPAEAQQASGAVFEQLLDVDVNAGNVGAVGCGGDDGSTLDIALGGDGSPASRPLDDRFDLFRYCDAIALGTANGWTGTADIGQAAESAQAIALAPEEIFAGIDQSAAVFDVQLGNIGQRLRVLRTARRGNADGVLVARTGRNGALPTAPALDASALGLDSLLSVAMAQGVHAQVGAAGDGDGDGRLGLFVNGRIHVVDIDSNRAESGSDSFGGGVTLGGDYRLGSWGHAGMSFGYTRLATSYSGSASDADLDSYAFSAYGAAYPTEQLYLDAILTGSILRFDTDNDLVLFDGGSEAGELSGEADGWTIGGSVAVGAELPAGPVVIGPFLRADVLHTRFDAFTQSGGDGTLDLRIDAQRSTSVTTDLGLGLSHAISTQIAVVTPHVRGAWVHEYDEQADALSGNLRALPNARFRIRPTSVDRDYASLGAGLAATFAGGFSQFIDYEALVGFSDVVTHQVTLGLRWAY
jgi:outer membrane autotransporter protein